MQDLRGNSYLQREKENTKQAPIVTNVTVKKQSEVAKFGKQIISEDVGNVGAKLKNDVIVPGLKKLLTDLGTNFINWLVYGVKGTPTSGTRTVNGLTHISYSSMFDKPVQQVSSTQKADLFTLDKIIFDTRGDAEVILLKMKEAISRYGMISAGDFYDMCGIPSVFTAQKYGWRDLSAATISRDGDKFYINFPKMTALE